MTNFAIMRCKKIKTVGSVAASLQHCFRERETLNANPEMSPENQHFAARSSDEAMGKLRALLPEKRRKDAVLAVEYVMTASPEWWQEASEWKQTKFFERSLEWLKEKYGENRIIAATIHKDEMTPHLSAFVVPLTKDGRLCAKDFVGGRAQLMADQSSFAERIESLGLTRGLRGSPATHQRVKSHYAMLQKPVDIGKFTPEMVQPKVLKKGVFRDEIETPEQVAQRLTEIASRHYRPMLESVSDTRASRKERDLLHEKNLELQRQMAMVQRYYDVLKDVPEEAHRAVFGKFRGAASELTLEVNNRIRNERGEAERLAMQRSVEDDKRRLMLEVEHKASVRRSEPSNNQPRRYEPPKP